MRVPSLIPSLRRIIEGITICPFEVAVVSICRRPPTAEQMLHSSLRVSQVGECITSPTCWRSKNAGYGRSLHQIARDQNGIFLAQLDQRSEGCLRFEVEQLFD